MNIQRIGNWKNLRLIKPLNISSPALAMDKPLHPEIRLSMDQGPLRTQHISIAVELSKSLGGGGGGDNRSSKIPVRIEAVLKELMRLKCTAETLQGVEEALIFAIQAFDGQTRKSGDPEFVHALEVLEILVLEDGIIEKQTLQAGILHDIKENTPYFEQLKSQFAEKEKNSRYDVPQLVDALSKFPKTHFANNSIRLSKYREALFSHSTNDYRISVIKLADRLANMRTLKHIPDELDRQRIAFETLKYFVPLANVLGMWVIKRELEDLSFRHLMPEAYGIIRSFLDKTPKIKQRRANHFEQILGGSLMKNDIFGARFTHKPRTAYSINQEINKFREKADFRGKLASLFDAFQKFKPLLDLDTFNIVVPTVDDCFTAMQLFQKAFNIPDENIQDFISKPKPNFYSSLNAEVTIPVFGQVRIKIRTEEMEAIADRGIVAHRMEYGRPLPEYWVRLVDSWRVGIEESRRPDSDIPRYLQPITVFTPKGEPIVLSKGSTPLDFAFMIHHKLALRALGAKIDGTESTLDAILTDGQQVSIIAEDKDAPINPKRELWISLISKVDGEARRRIRRFLEERNEAENINFGRYVLDRKFKEAKGQSFLGYLYKTSLTGEQLGDAVRELAKVCVPHQKSMRHPAKNANTDKKKRPLRPMETLNDVCWYVGTLNLDPEEVLKIFKAS